MPKKKISPADYEKQRYNQNIDKMAQSSGVKQTPESLQAARDAIDARGSITYSTEYSPSRVAPNAAASQRVDFGEAGLNERLGEGLLPEENLQNVYAANQGAGEQLASGFARTVGGALLKASQGISILGSGIGEATVGWWTGEDRGFNLDNVVDNPINDIFFRTEDALKELLPVYKGTDWDNKNFLQQVGTTRWWADEGADAIAFALSNFVPAGAIGKLGLGAKAARALGAGIRVAEEGGELINEGRGLFGLASRVGDKLGKAGEMGEFAKTLLLDKSGLANPIKFARNLDMVTQNALMTSSEAFFEAKDTGEQIQQKFLEDAGFQDIEQLTAEQKEQLQQKKGNAMKATFFANLGALAFSNQIEAGFINKIFGNSISKAGKAAINAGGTLEDAATPIVRKGFNRFFNESIIGSVAKNLPKFAIMEGLYEENIQDAIQKVSKNFGSEGKMDYIQDVLEQSVANLSDKEAWKSIGAGIVVGGLFGASGSVSEFKEEQEKTAKAINSINTTKDNMLNIKNTLYEKNEDGSFKYDANGEPILNKEALADYTANTTQMQDLADLHDLYKDSGANNIASIIKDEAFTKFTLSHLESGLDDELFAKIKALSKYKDEDLAEMGYDPIDIQDGERITTSKKVSELTEKAKQIQEDYNTVLRTIPENDTARINEAVKYLSRFRTLERLDKNLSAALQLRSEVTQGNAIALSYNFKAVQLQAQKNALASALINGISLQSEEKLRDAIQNTEVELKALRESNLDNKVKFPKDNNSLIEDSSSQLPDIKKIFSSISKVAEARAAKEEVLTKYNAITDFRTGRAAYDALIVNKAIVKTANEGAVILQEQEANDRYSEIQEGNFAEFVDDGGQVQRGFVGINDNGELNLAGNLLNPAFISKYPNLKIYTPEETEEYKTGVLSDLRKKQLQKKIRLAQERLDSISKNITGQEDKLLDTLIDKEQLITNRDAGMVRISEARLNKKLETIEKAIERIETAIDVYEGQRDDLSQELEYLKESLEDGTPVEDSYELLDDYVEVLADLDAELESQRGILDKLRENLIVFQNLWTRLFPNKKRQLEKGRQEYAQAKQEITLTKAEIKEIEVAVDSLVDLRKGLQTKITYLENEIKEHELALSKLTYTRRLNPESYPVSIETISGKANAIKDPPKPDIAITAFNKTAGNHKGKDGLTQNVSQRRFFKWTNEFNPYFQKGYTLRTVTINDPEYGLKGTVENIYTEEAPQYHTENNIKVIVVDNKKKPVLRDSSILHTSLIEVNENRKSLADYVSSFTGEEIFTNKTGSKNLEIKVINDHKTLVSKAKASPVYLPILYKSAGIPVSDGELNTAKQVFGSINIPIGIVTDGAANLGGLDYRMDNGLVYANYNGRPVAATFRTLSENEQVAVLEKLKEYASLRGEGKGKSIINTLTSTIFLSKRKNNPELSAYFVKGQEAFVFGDAIITTEQLKSGQYDMQLLDFLSKINHDVSRSTLAANEEFTDVFNNKWKSYTDYLLTARKNKTETPLLFDLTTKDDFIDHPQFINMYLGFGNPVAEPAKTTKPKAVAKPSPIVDFVSSMPSVNIAELDAINNELPAQDNLEEVGLKQPEPGFKLDYDTVKNLDKKLANEKPKSSGTDLGAVEQTTQESTSNRKEISDGLSEEDRIAAEALFRESIGGDLFLDAGRIRNYKLIDLEKEEDWFSKNISSIPFLKVKGLIDGRAFGKFTQAGQVLISDTASEGTVYHEAFHVVSQLYLSPAERVELYNDWRKENPGEFTDLQIEEQLAEEFRDFVLTKQGRSIFRKILDFIKALFAIPNKQQLFNRINTGFYKDSGLKELNERSLYSLPFDALTIKDLMDSMTFLLLRQMFKDGFSVKDIYRYNNNLLNDEDRNKFGGIYNKVIFAVTKFLANVVITSPNTEASEKIDKQLIPYIQNNRQSVIQDHIKFLSRYNISITSEAEVEEIPEEEKVKDTYGIIDSIEFSAKSMMPNVIKLLIASLPKTTIEGKMIYNSLGMPSASDYKRNVNILHNELSGLSTLKEQVQKINSIIPRIPELKLLLEQLGVSGDGTLNTSITEDQFNLQSAFRQQFDKYNYKFFTQLFGESSNFLVDANSDNLTNIIRTKWRKGSVLRKEALVNVGGVSSLNKGYFIKNYGQPIKNLELKRANVFEFFNDLGITFSRPEEVNFEILNDRKNAMMKRIEDNTFVDIFSDEAGAKGWLKDLINQELSTSLDYSDNQHINPNGKTVYNISLNDYLTQTASTLKQQELPEYLQWNEETKTGNPAVRNSKWLKKRDKLEVVILEGSRIQEQGESGKVAAKLNTGDAASLQFTSVLSGVYPFMQASDKSLAKGFTFGGKPKALSYPEMRESFRGYLSDEIVSAWNLVNEGIGEEFPEYAKNGKDLVVFKGIFSDVKIRKYQSIINHNGTITEVIDKADAFAKVSDAELQSWFDSNVKENLQLLKDSRLVIGNNTSSYSLLGVSQEQAKQFVEKTNGLSEGQLNSLVENFTHLYLQSNIEQTKLFTGSLSFYKDFFKRTAGLVGTGKTTWIGKDVDAWLNQNAARYYKDKQGNNIQRDKESDGKIKSIVFTDVLTKSTNYESYLKAFVNKGMDEDYAKQLLNKYNEGYEEGDAQGYMTLPEYKEYRLRTATWSNSHDAIYDKLISGEKLKPQDFSSFFGYTVDKPVYFGPQDAGGIFVPTYYKFSVMPLIPSVVKGTGLETLMYNMLNSGVGMSMFKTANKVGSKNTNAFYNEDGSVTSLKDAITQTIDYKYLKVQLDIAPDAKHKVVFGTQFRKLVLANLAGQFVTIGGKKIEGNRLIKTYNGLINDLIRIETDSLVQRLGLTKTEDDDSYSITKPDFLRNLLEKNAESRSLPDNVVVGINQVLGGNTTKTFDILVNRNKIENILMSLVNNNIIKSQVFGEMKVQGASTGFETKGRTKAVTQSDVQNESWYSDIEITGTSNSLSFYKVNENGTEAMEIYLPHYFKEYLGDSININTIDKRLLNLVGFRTPTQGLNSIELMRIKGFLPPEAGNLIVVPSEIVVKAGSDFDIDKLTLFYPNYKTLYNWNELQRDFFKVYNVLGKMDLQLLVDKVEAEKVELTDEEQRINAAYQQFIKDNKEKYVSSLSYIEYDDNSKENKKAIQNRLYDIAWKIVSAPENFTALITPNGFDNLKALANELKAITKKKETTLPQKKKNKNTEEAEDEIEKKLVINHGENVSWKKNLYTRAAYLLGKAGVGQVALHNVHHVLSQIVKLKAKPEVKLYLNHNGENQIDFSQIKSFGQQDNINSPTILEIISEFLNGFVDIAKDPFLADINGSTDTAPTYLYLLRAGVPLKEAVYFMNQPIIKDYLNELSVNQSLFLKATENNINRDDVKAKIIKQWGNQELIFEVNEDGEIQRKAFTEEQLKSNLTNPDRQSQVTILNDFLKYQENANSLSDLITATTSDTRGGGATLNAAQEAIDVYEKVKENGIFENVESFMKETFIGSFYNTVKNSLQMYKPLFVTEIPEVKNKIAQIKRIIELNEYISGTDKERSLNIIKNEVINYILQKQQLQNIKIGNLTESLFIGENSLPRLVAAAKNDPVLQNNLLVRELFPLLSKSLLNKPETAEDLNNIKTFNKRVDTLDSNLLTDAWKELFGSHTKIAQDLMFFSILQSGLNNSPISFAQYIPNEYYAPVANHLINKFKLNPQMEDFIDKVLRNKYRDSNLVPKYKRFRIGFSGYTSNIIKGNLLVYSRDSRRGYPILKVWNSTIKDWDLFRNTNIDTEKGNRIFEPVGKLGDGYNLAEYNVEESIILSNRVKTSDTTTNEIQKTKPKEQDTIEKVKADMLTTLQSQETFENIPEAYRRVLIKRISNTNTIEELAELQQQLCK